MQRTVQLAGLQSKSGPPVEGSGCTSSCKKLSPHRHDKGMFTVQHNSDTRELKINQNCIKNTLKTQQEDDKIRQVKEQESRLN